MEAMSVTNLVRFSGLEGPFSNQNPTKNLSELIQILKAKDQNPGIRK